MATRRERVILELQDDLTPGMVRAAAATKLVQRELKGIDGTNVDLTRSSERATKATKEFSLTQAIAEEKAARLRKELRDQARAVLDADAGISALDKDTDRLGRSSDRTGKSINQLSGRLSLLARGFAVLGPTLAPISTVAVAGVAGLASQFGFAATGALSLVVAAQGVGDALKAVNEAALEPTAANLEKAREAMSRLGPDAQAFVQRFQEIRPALKDIRDSAAAGWFPGLTESLTSLEDIAPEVASLFEKIGRTGGNLVAEGAAAFAGPGWADFRAFIAAEAPKALDDLGRTLGNVAKGLSELWMAFGPLNSSFSSWLLDASRGFAEWADGLAQTEGFQEFVDYIRTNGPKVADAVVAIANALLQIGEAAAPLGGPVLDALTSIANAIAVIADSPLGTPIMAGVTAMSALSIATNVATAALGRFTVASAAAGAAGAGAAGKGAAGKGGGLLGLAGGGPVGLAALATLIGSAGHIENIDKGVSGERDPFEGLLRSAVPALNTLEQFGITLPGLSKDTEELGFSALGLGNALDVAAGQASTANQRLIEYTQTSLGAFSATTQYREALKAATEQANSNSAGIRGNSDAALANRSALEQLAGAWQNQRDQMVSTGTSTDQIAGKQRAARQAFIATAEAMGVSRKRARELADALLGIPPAVSSSVNVAGLGAALAGVRTLKRELAGLGNPKVSAPQPSGTGPLFGGDPTGNGADGTTVPKTGRPYADRHLYLLADGEEVISNRHGQADRHRPLLKAINAGLLANGGTAGVEGLASGGTARRRRGSALGIHLMDPLGITLADWIKQLEASRDALQSENEARQSLVKELGDTVAGKFTSSLFGQTDVWSKGGSLQDAIATLMGDTAGANAFSSNVDRLKALGLDDAGALNALLSQADAATIANIAATATPEVIAQYEQTFQVRQQAIANAQNVAMAAQTAALSALQVAANAKLDQINAQLAAGNKTLSTVGPSAGSSLAKSTKRGAGNASRNRKRG